MKNKKSSSAFYILIYKEKKKISLRTFLMENTIDGKKIKKKKFIYF
jgi:hypothetical protein